MISYTATWSSPAMPARPATGFIFSGVIAANVTNRLVL